MPLYASAAASRRTPTVFHAALPMSFQQERAGVARRLFMRAVEKANLPAAAFAAGTASPPLPQHVGSPSFMNIVPEKIRGMATYAAEAAHESP